MTLLVLEALTPFYIFQLFSLLVWLCEQYYYYAVAIVIMSVVGISTSIIQTRKNQQNLKGTINFTSTVMICRPNDVHEEIPTTQLVPGDVILIPPHGCEMQCDAVLLSGSCIVNESMLTGESVPVTKTPLDHHDTLYNLKEDVNHTLFCGTKVIQTRTHGNELVRAVVIRTGFLTTKGELVRSILYPPPADFKFDRDSYKFIGILAFIAGLGFIYTIVSKLSRLLSSAEIIVKALDIITIVIPPALPAAMTVGKLYAIQRLKSHKIFCINSRVVNVSGSLDCICFDKTGTLTEDALDMWGVIPVKNEKILEPVKDIEKMPSSSEIFRGMTVCHSLTAIDGTVVGDPLDINMFESTQWEFADGTCLSKEGFANCRPVAIVRSPNKNNEVKEIAILKQFQFSSAFQRMSVIIKSAEEYFEVFCKGSPEKIIALSKDESIPDDIREVLKKYTEKGYRVIGIGSKRLPETFTYESIRKIHRHEVENELNFLGLLILENPLKPETTGVIQTLKEARLKVVMITGDNIQTAVTVARECQIINNKCTVIEVLTEKPTKHDFASISYHILNNATEITSNGSSITKDPEAAMQNNQNYCFIVSGDTWHNLKKYFPDLVPKITTKGVVFARMTGAQKQQLVEELKGLGYYVAMCGDGANDCGALKAAHVGISLSENESSIASPFTSKEPNISCMPKVLKEGRAALVTSFGVFQLMLCYSLTEFASVILLYGIDSNLSSLQFLFIDICLILNFTSVFGHTKAYEKLAKKPPRTSLLSFIPLCSITFFMILAILSQIFAFYYIQTYDWFVPFKFNPALSGVTSFFPSYENYAVFSTSLFQYITMAIVFSKGKPYRKSIFTNKLFLISVLLMTIFCAYITLYPPDWIIYVMELKVPVHLEGRLMCIWVGAVTFTLCYIVQSFVVEIFLERLVEPVIMANYWRNKKKYLEVIQILNNEAYWPMTNLGETKACYENEIKQQNGIDNSAFVNS
ncbi:polyamine-transporting ATPase 13A3-like isoform X2 [Anthonomus grandis grandis]|nr:polyamine-transporting ATPase 13A3-like isoform X2 [Anthonomus grandis grandis]